MTRVQEVRDRISSIAQIEEIIAAMRALAAAHAREAQDHLAAVRIHEQTVALAIAETFAGAAGGHAVTPAASQTGRHLRIVVGAEQGFCGTYNERVLEHALKHQGQGGAIEFMAIGRRCEAEFDRLGTPVIGSAIMAGRPRDVPALASRIADTLFERIAAAPVLAVSVVSAVPQDNAYAVIERRVMPFDFSRFPPPAAGRPPMTTLPPARLLEGLVEEYVFSELCEALLLGFAAENDARMNAMMRARSNVDAMRIDLQNQYNQTRQQETTTEIIELATTVPRKRKRLHRVRETGG